VYHYYDLLVSIFVVILLISNLVGQKICAFGPFHIFADLHIERERGTALVPDHLYLGDIFTEVYGYSASRRRSGSDFSPAVNAALGAIVVALRRSEVAQPASVRHRFWCVPRLVIASLIRSGAASLPTRSCSRR